MPQSVRTTSVPPRRLALSCAFACGVAVAGCTADTSPSAPSSTDPTASVDVRSYGARAPFWSGVYLGDAETTPARVAEAIGAFASLTGKRPAMVKSFHRLDADLSPKGWAGGVLHAIQSAGATNIVALDLDWQGRPAGSLLEAINRGDADARVDRVAHDIALVGGVVLIEPGWEMNGSSSYPWQGVANGADRTAPARYVAAARRVVDRFR